MLAGVVQRTPHTTPRVALLIGIAAATAPALRAAVEALGWSTVDVESGAEALEEFGFVHPSLVIVDGGLRDLPALQVVRQLRAACARLPIVALVPAASSDVAGAAARAGAEIAIVAPGRTDDVTRVLRSLPGRHASEQLGGGSPERPDDGRLRFFSSYRSVFRGSALMRAVERSVFELADTDGPVLLLGEGGTGKKTVARAIHYLSRRGPAGYAKVNCAAIPPHLLEAEIFGVGEGEMTNAPAAHGAIRHADNGSLIVEEFSELPAAAQARLSLLLQENPNVRLLATTTKDVESLVRGGAVRDELYARLSALTISIPPLRDRTEEIPRLAEFFRVRFMEEFRREARDLSEPLVDLLRAYHWPGNVLELENVIKRYVVVGDEQQLTQELRGRARDARSRQQEAPHSDTLQSIGQRAARQAEMAVILETLERVQWNRAEAARRLKVSYKTLLNKLHRAGITGRGGRMYPGA